jgi:hypothetical protein
MDVKAMSRNLISYGLRALALVAMALLLQACSTGGVNMGNLFKDDKPQAQQAEQQEAQQAPPPVSSGPVKVALLLPLSAPGETASISAKPSRMLPRLPCWMPAAEISS